MFGHDFDNQSISKYVVIFGNLFNNIKIARKKENGGEQKFIVPIGFGSREKWLARIETDPEMNRPYSQLVPRLAFELTGFEYDGKRKLETTFSYKQATTDGSKTQYQRVYSPVPYNIGFRLHIIAKASEDAHRIFEQIVAYFTPEWTLTVHLLEDFPDYSLDIPLVRVASEFKDELDGEFKKRRAVGYTIDFVMKAYLFGPTSKAKIIKVAKTNLYSAMDASKDIVHMTIQPGMTANGEPTSVLADSISPLEIEETDTYGYIVTIEEELQ